MCSDKWCRECASGSSVVRGHSECDVEELDNERDARTSTESREVAAAGGSGDYICFPFEYRYTAATPIWVCSICGSDMFVS